MNWVLFLFSISLIAVFTSQTLVDVADTLVITSALFLAFKRKELKDFFTSFKPAWLWPLWLFIIILGIVVNVGISNGKAWSDFLEFRWILTFLGFIYLASRWLEQNKLILTWAWILVPLNIITIVVDLMGSAGRAQGLLKATMAFSQNIAPIMCLFAVYCFSSWSSLNRKNKILFAVVAVTSTALMFMTYTRGVWIGSFVGISMALAIWNRKYLVGFLVTFGVIISMLVITSNTARNRVLNKSIHETQSNDERIALWKGNWRIIQDYPILGVGHGQNKFHLRKYYDEFGYPQDQRESHAHNQYLQVWGGTGTLGLLCYLSFMGLILAKTYQGYRASSGTVWGAWQLGLLASLFCFWVGALTESNFNIAKNRYLFLMLAALAVVQAVKASNLADQIPSASHKGQ